MKKTTFVELISSLLLFFFLFTAISSYLQLQSLKNLLAFYTINTSVVAWTFILAEALIALFLFLRQTRTIGLISALLMILYAGLMIRRFPSYPHDFGGLFNYLNTDQEWLLITLLVILCIAGLILTLLVRKNHRPVVTNKPQFV